MQYLWPHQAHSTDPGGLMHERPVGNLGRFLDARVRFGGRVVGSVIALAMVGSLAVAGPTASAAVPAPAKLSSAACRHWHVVWSVAGVYEKPASSSRRVAT